MTHPFQAADVGGADHLRQQLSQDERHRLGSHPVDLAAAGHIQSCLAQAAVAVQGVNARTERSWSRYHHLLLLLACCCCCRSLPAHPPARSSTITIIITITITIIITIYWWLPSHRLASKPRQEPPATDWRACCWDHEAPPGSSHTFHPQPRVLSEHYLL